MFDRSDRGMPSIGAKLRRLSSCVMLLVLTCSFLVICSSTSSAATVPPWRPSPHFAPDGAAWYGPVVVLVDFLARHRFFVLFGSLFGSVILIVMRAGGRKALPLYGAIMTLGVFNLMFGTWLANWLIYQTGVAGSAVITDTYETAAQYNNHDVLGYRMLIRTADGRTLETRFEDDDFNVYPSHNETTYPPPGLDFTIRYVSNWPRTFVIVADDDSPWARWRRP